MSIEYRGDSKYRFRVRKDGINYSLNYFCNKKLAEEDIKKKIYPKEVQDAHKKFEVEIMSGKIGYNENMKFSELAQLVLDEEIKPNKSKNTVGIYLNAYNNHLLEEFGNKPINKIKKLNVVQFKNKKLKDFKPATVSKIISVMSATYNVAIEWEIIKENPCRKIKIDIPKKNYNELMTEKDMQTLIIGINKEPEPFKTIFLTTLGMGYRKGEALGLAIPNISFDDDYIDMSKQLLVYNENGKTYYETSDTKTPYSVRKSHMPPFVKSALLTHVKNLKVTDKESHLFVNPYTGKVYTHSAIYKRFKNLLKKCGLDSSLTFHDLRHLQAIMLVNSGADLMSIAKRLGDTVQVIDKTYLHSMDRAEKESASKIENFIDSIKQIDEA